MIHYVNNCQSCPFLEYKGGGVSICKHPAQGVKQVIANEEEKNIHQDCPLKKIDLILTIRER